LNAEIQEHLYTAKITGGESLLPM